MSEIHVTVEITFLWTFKIANLCSQAQFQHISDFVTYAVLMYKARRINFQIQSIFKDDSQLTNSVSGYIGWDLC